MDPDAQSKKSEPHKPKKIRLYEKWLEDFNWMIYEERDEKTLCKLCIKAFKSGVTAKRLQRNGFVLGSSNFQR